MATKKEHQKEQLPGLETPSPKAPVIGHLGSVATGFIPNGVSPEHWEARFDRNLDLLPSADKAEAATVRELGFRPSAEDNQEQESVPGSNFVPYSFTEHMIKDAGIIDLFKEIHDQAKRNESDKDWSYYNLESLMFKEKPNDGIYNAYNDSLRALTFLEAKELLDGSTDPRTEYMPSVQMRDDKLAMSEIARYCIYKDIEDVDNFRGWPKRTRKGSKNRANDLSVMINNKLDELSTLDDQQFVNLAVEAHQSILDRAKFFKQQLVDALDPTKNKWYLLEVKRIMAERKISTDEFTKQ